MRGVPATSFVGRRKELAHLSRLFARARLLTITGPGGSGKTRLARALVDRLRSGRVAWLDLAELTDPANVLPAIERAIGGQGAGTLAADTIRGAIGPRDLILVLDNCEHVIDASRTAVARLLETAAATRVLATSRSALGLPDEIVWYAPPLSLPAVREEDGPGHGIRFDAIRLFVERARSARPTFMLDATTAADVGAICRKLDGHPLAIELAAARLRHLPLGELSDQIGSIEILAGDDTAPARHRTMTATISWSYDLLTAPERTLLRRLSVFPGGATIRGAEAVVNGDVSDVARALGALIDRSLIEFTPAAARYRLLEPIREFGVERLRERDEENATLALAARYLAVLGGTLTPEHGLLEGDLRLRDEFPNILVVMPWLVRNHTDAALGLLIRAADRHRTAVPVHLSVLRSWIEQALARHRQRDRSRAQGLVALARTIWALGVDGHDIVLARRATDEALSIAGELGDGDTTQEVLFTRTALAFRSESRGRALATFDVVIPKLRRPRLAAFARSGRAVLRQHLGDAPGADADLRDAFAVWDTIEDPQVTDSTVTFFSAAEIAFCRGDRAEAETHLRSAVAARAASGEAQEALPFDFLAHLSALAGDTERALRLSGIADRLAQEHGRSELPWYRLADRSWVTAAERVPKSAMLRSQGRTMTDALAIAYALGERVAVGLTPREAAVADLVAAGLTDKEIAVRLAVSRRTVENHVQRVRDKLGLRSRTQVARWVAESMSDKRKPLHATA